MSFFDLSLFEKGGPILWVLLVVALFALVIFIERVLYLHRGQIRSTEFVNGIKNILAKGRLMEALTVCEETPGPVAAVVKAALLHANESDAKIRFEVQEAALVELPVLERRLGSLAALGQVIPLLGLFGTVLGMISTFQAFETGGDYAHAGALSVGMWQALLSLAASLAIAIPTNFAHHFLSGRVRALVRDMEWSANEIMKYLHHEYRVGGKEENAVIGK